MVINVQDPVVPVDPVAVVHVRKVPNVGKEAAAVKEAAVAAEQNQRTKRDTKHFTGYPAGMSAEY